ncbi:MAG: efflux RND transporter periplasmic adaptor subunit [Muribaculaceae bacterium]|nr:efflux RND transporter periplasmic adaptor subunit [Muribaculaceae bacterium]
MNKQAIILLCCSALLAGCHKHDSADEELKHHHHHHHEHAAGTPHSHEVEGEHEESEEHADGEIVLAPEMAERFGVKVQTVEAAPLGTTLRATGVVTDAADGAALVSAPVAGTVRFAAGIMPGSQLKAGATVASINTSGVAGGDTNAAAKAALDAAKRELDRLEPLHAERLITDDVYNAARATYESARAAYSAGAAGGRATAPISGTVTELLVAQGAYVEAGAPVARMSAARNLVLRVDVPERQRSRLAGITGVNVRVPGSEDVQPLKARRVQAAPAVAAAMPGYVPVYFEILNDGTLAPGAAVDAWLTTDASGAAVLSVPRTAIAEQQGNYYVYRRLDEDCYMKLPVKTGASDGMRVVITSGLEGGEEIVTEGVTAIRLAETAGVVPEGHSHNH